MTIKHPNLDANYFEKIDTKEKAYWLGFLYADGCVQRKQISIKIHNNDKRLLDKFADDIGANKETMFTEEKRIVLKTGTQKMIGDLISHGCVPRKSKIIELSSLRDQRLYLTFLLGYYDGDGTQNKTLITSGSKKFLEQIKEKFKLPYKITKSISSGTINGRKVIGSAYNIYLGARLFNEMMDNYEHSLPRKRRYFCTKEEKARRSREASKHNTGKKKFEITKEELEKLVWEIPTSKIAKQFGVSDTAIAKRCKKLGIKKPSRGYWAKNPCK